MAWTAPRTFITGEVTTAAHFNTHLRDNIIDLDRRTSMVAASVGQISAPVTQGTTSATYVDLATLGPALTVTIGSTGKAMVAMSSTIAGSIAGSTGHMAFQLSGANVLAASDFYALIYAAPLAGYGHRSGITYALFGVNAGSTTITTKYRVAGGGQADFTNRGLMVTPLGS